MTFGGGTGAAGSGLSLSQREGAPTVMPSDTPRPGDDKETDRDPSPQSPAEPLPEEDLEQVEEQPS